jgi:hypothetical protein
MWVGSTTINLHIDRAKTGEHTFCTFWGTSNLSLLPEISFPPRLFRWPFDFI